MKFNAKQLLLAGTALVAVGFSTQAHAAAIGINDNTATPVTNDYLTTSTDTKYVNLNLNNTSPTIGQSATQNAMTINHNSTVYVYDSAAAGKILTITGNTTDAITVAGSKTLTLEVGKKNDGTANTNTVVVNFNKNIVSTGTTNINTSGGNGQTISFATGADTVNLGATGQIKLGGTNDVLGFASANAQTVTGNITGATAGAGKVNITNSNATGITFNGTIGTAVNTVNTINIDRGVAAIGTNNTATFTKDVATANGITLGNAGQTGTVTAKFGAGSGSMTVTGAIAGTEAGNINNIAVVAGSTVAFTGNIGTHIDNINSGANASTTNVTFGGNVGSGAISLDGTLATAINNATFGTNGQTTTVAATVAGANTTSVSTVLVTGGSTVTFNNGIGANIDDIKVGANSTTTNATFAGNLTSGNVSFEGTQADANTTITIGNVGSGVAVAGTINSANTASTTTLNLGAGGSQTVTLSGIVGGSGSIDTINVKASSTAKTIQNITATTLHIENLGTLELNGNAAQTINANVTAAATSTGAIKVINQHASGTTFAENVGITGGNAIQTITVSNANATNSNATFAKSVATLNGITLGQAGQNSGTNAVTFGSNGVTSTVAGAIAGQAAGQTNNIFVAGGANVTFSGAFGADLDNITIGADTKATQVTFGEDIAAVSGSFLIGNGATADTNTVTFDTTSTAGDNILTVGSMIVGAHANDTNNLVVKGNKTVAFSNGTNADIDGISIEGTTTLNLGNATTTTAGISFTGAGVLNANAGLVTSNINLGTGGTTNLASGVNVTGSISGAGTVNTAGASTITGNLTGVATLSLSGGANVAVTGNAGAGATRFLGDGKLTVGAAAGAAGNVGGTVDNLTGFASKGTLEFISNAASGTQTVSGNIGATNNLKAVTLNGRDTTFQGTILQATTLTMGAGNVDAKAVTTLATGIAFGANDKTVALGDGVTFTGSAASAGGSGTITVDGSATINATIGTANGDRLKGLTLNGGSGKTVALNTAVFADTLTIGGAGTVNAAENVNAAVNFTANGALNVAAGKTVTSIDAGTTGFGSVTFAGSSTVTGKIGNTHALNALTISGTSGNTLTVGNDFRSANTMNIAGNKIDITGTFTAAAGQELFFTITTPTTAGQIKSSGAATIDAQTKVTVNVATTDYISDGSKFTLIDGTGGTGIAKLDANKLIITNSALVEYKQDTSTSDLIIIAHRKSLETAQLGSGAGGENVNVIAKTIDALGNNATGDVKDFLVRAQAETNTTKVANMYNSLQSNTVVTAVAAPIASAQTASIISSAISSAVSGVFSSSGGSANSRGIVSNEYGAQTGISAGDRSQSGVRFWMQALGSRGTQDIRQGISGYHSKTSGAVAGVDYMATDRFLIGLAGGYSTSDIDVKDTNRSNLETENYQAFVYGNYDLTPRTHLSGMAGYIWSDNESVRHDVGAIVGNNAFASYDSDQYMARLELGHDLMAKKNMIFTPSVFANYGKVSFDSYSERGAGGLGLANVRTEDLKSLELGVNTRAEWAYSMNDKATILPNLHAGAGYDVIGDGVQTTAALAGGGAAFRQTGADPAQARLNIGTGVKLLAGQNWEVEANYDYTRKEDFREHSGYARASFKF